jgi:hypothetical protein
MFDAIPISVVFVSEIEAAASAGIAEWCRSIDEKHCVINVVFFAQSAEERVSGNVCSRWFKLCMR